jgi:quinohemoprotein ethanol dehydrogenase
MADPAATASNWMTYGGTYSEQRFSPLKQIDSSNVSRLGLAWFSDYDTNLQQDGTPLEIDGVIYVSTAWSRVYAFDARTGKTLWQYDPKTPGQWVRNLCCGIVNRGVAAWKGKIYLGTLDGRLVAIDARTGKPVWERLTIDAKQRYSITSAPRAWPRGGCWWVWPAASMACAAISALTTPRPASSTGASTPCPVIPRSRSRTMR